MIVTFIIVNITIVGKFYVVDSGFSNQPGYLAPYKGTKYHFKSTIKVRHQEVKNKPLIIDILKFTMQ